MFNAPNFGFFDFENNINRALRNMMSEANHLRAIMLLDLNIELFPDSANAWSILGDALRIRGDFAKGMVLDLKGRVGTNTQEIIAILEKE